MEKKKALLVISNHNPEEWSKEQRAGWEYIEYYPFPYVSANADEKEIIDLSIPVSSKIGEFYRFCDDNGYRGYVNLQGEYTLCKVIYDALRDEDVKFTFPSSERIVEEYVDENCNNIKKCIFKFVRWRIL